MTRGRNEEIYLAVRSYYAPLAIAHCWTAPIRAYREEVRQWIAWAHSNGSLHISWWRYKSIEIFISFLFIKLDTIDVPSSNPLAFNKTASSAWVAQAFVITYFFVQRKTHEDATCFAKNRPGISCWTHGSRGNELSHLNKNINPWMGLEVSRNNNELLCCTQTSFIKTDQLLNLHALHAQVSHKLGKNTFSFWE